MEITREGYGLSRIWDNQSPTQVNKGGPINKVGSNQTPSIGM